MLRCKWFKNRKWILTTLVLPAEPLVERIREILVLSDFMRLVVIRSLFLQKFALSDRKLLNVQCFEPHYTALFLNLLKDAKSSKVNSSMLKKAKRFLLSISEKKLYPTFYAPHDSYAYVGG